MNDFLINYFVEKENTTHIFAFVCDMWEHCDLTNFITMISSIAPPSSWSNFEPQPTVSDYR